MKRILPLITSKQNRGITSMVKSAHSIFHYIYSSKRMKVFFSFPIFSQTFSMMNIVLLGGYLGIIFTMVSIFRKKICGRQDTIKREHLSTTERKSLIKIKRYLRSFTLLMIILCICGFTGLWYLQGSFSFQYFHLFILIITNLILGYINVSIKEKKSQFPLPLELQKKPKHMKHPKIIGIIMCVNAIILLLFCIVFVHLRNAPFYGIWGVIAWAGTLLLSYSPFIVLHELFQYEKEIIYIASIFLSWILVFFWLGLGLEIESFMEKSESLLIIFCIGYWLMYVLYYLIFQKKINHYT
jgi:hypothetical protein